MTRTLIVGVLGTVLATLLQAATVSISPSSESVSAGSLFSLSVGVTDVGDLYSYQFDLAFDPGVLSAVDITEGAFLTGGGPTFFIPGTIDNLAGTISFTGNVLLGAVPGVSGDGTLTTVQFLALAPGTSPIALSNIILLDSNLVDIPASVVDDSVGVNAIPEPSSIALTLFGIGAIGGLSAFKRKNPREDASTRSSTAKFRAV